MSIAKVALITSLFVSQALWAGVLDTKPGQNKISDVAIATSARTNVEGRQADLGLLGAGLRQKKKAFLNFDVYVAQLFADTPVKFTHVESDALNSLNNMQTVALQLTFLRNVDAETVMESFKEALTANNVDFSSGTVKGFLDAVSTSGDGVEGKTFTIVAERLSNGVESVTYEGSSGKATTLKGAAGFIKNLFSIWLGEPADGGLEKLKTALVTGSAQ